MDCLRRKRLRSKTHKYRKVTNFATLILRKVKEIGINPTTRFEDLDLNCALG